MLQLSRLSQYTHITCSSDYGWQSDETDDDHSLHAPICVIGSGNDEVYRDTCLAAGKHEVACLCTRVLDLTGMLRGCKKMPTN